MSIKFLRSAANQYLSVPDGAGTTFPNSNWVLAWVMAFDSATADTDGQYLLSTGAFGSSGSLQVISYPPSSGVIPGARIAIQIGTNANGATPDLKSASAITSGVYVFVLQRSGTSLSLRHCPVLSGFPSDSSAVILDQTVTLSTALDGGAGLFVGSRSDLNTLRFADVSLARFFRFDGVVTDLEVAKLAYGMEISDLGKTPSWYFKMDTPSDITDLGTLGLVATPHGSLATGTAPGFGYTGVIPTDPTIDVTAPTADRIYQRTSGLATIPLSGSYTGTAPTSIEYQLFAENGTTVLKAWTVVTATFGSGAWSGNISVASGGMYRIQVRSNLASSAIKASLFAVGGNFFYTGSSSANRAFTTASGTGFTPKSTVRRYLSAAWSAFGTDGCSIKMANSLSDQGAIPIGMVNCGVEGETLASWLNTSGSSWTSFAAAVAANGGKMEFLGMAMGSNDAANGIVVSRAQHAANLRQFISNVRTLTGQPNLPVVISGFNGRPGVTTQQADFVRMAENDVGNDANVSAVQIVDLPLIGDNIHLTPAGFTTSGDRLTYVLGRRVFGDGTYLRGPLVTAITYTSSLIKVALAHRNGTDFTPTSGIAGFVGTDDSGALPFSSVARSGASEITITPTRAIVGTPAVTYLSGSGQASSSSVMDNGTLPLPMNIETSMTATAAGTSTVTSVTVTPASITVAGGGTVDFDWTIQGASNPSQAATVSTSLGTITSAGVVTAPAATTSAQTGTVTVTSVQDPTKSGIATFTILALTPTPTPDPTGAPVLALYAPMIGTFNIMGSLL